MDYRCTYVQTKLVVLTNDSCYRIKMNLCTDKKKKSCMESRIVQNGDESLIYNQESLYKRVVVNNKDNTL